MQLMLVVFPDPLGPSRPKISPLDTRRSKWSSASRSSYRLTRPFTEMMSMVPPLMGDLRPVGRALTICCAKRAFSR